jgi:hypothetical protein
MSYVEQSLLPQESIVATTKLHPIIFWKPVRNALCSLLFLWAGHSAAVLGLITASLAQYSIGIALGPLIGQVLVTMAALLAVVAVAGAVARLALYTTTEFAVTNKRVIAKYGSLRRRSLGARHRLHRSLWGYRAGTGVSPPDPAACNDLTTPEHAPSQVRATGTTTATASA